MTDRNEALSNLPHKLATLIQCLPQAPFRDHLADECIKQAERIAELEVEIADFHTTMFAAAVEIHEHWDAHCDAEGYGPANLMHRLERGISSQYGYDAKTLQRVEAERDQLRAEVERLRADAERYQWLRDCHPADGTLWVAMGLPHAPGGVSCWRDSELDAAIDQARTTHKDEG